MFGIKEIIGKETVKLINGKKFRLPSFTHATKGDKLLLVKLKDDLALFNSESYLNLIQELEFKYYKTEDLNEKKELKILIKHFYYSIIRELKCDSKHMITIPDNIPSIYKINSGEINCIGKRKHLILKQEKKN